jgi:hypothetical protein
MKTILPLGALLALSLAGCSGSTNSLTGPDDEIRPSMDPGSRQSRTPSDLPSRHPCGHEATASSAAGSGTLSVWYSSLVESSAGCTRISPSV